MGGKFRARGLISTSLLVTSLAGCQAAAPEDERPSPVEPPARPAVGATDAIGIVRATDREAPASFVARPRGATVFFAADAIGFTIATVEGRQNLRWVPRGARATEPNGLHERPSRTTRLTAEPRPQGSERPREWTELVYHELWDGIDLVASAASRSYAYRFELEGGRDARRIDLEWEGAEQLTVDADGRGLTVATATGDVRETGLRCFELGSAAGGGDLERDVPCRFRVEGTRYGFDVERVDPSARLVIDPVVDWGTYVGGSSAEEQWAVTTDADQNVYLAGATFSTDFPIVGGFDDTYAGNGQLDGTIMKLDRTGAVVWSSYLGGAGGFDRIRGIAVDAQRNVVVVGETQSDDFPLVNAIDTENDFTFEAFVTKVAADGESIVFSTFYGSSSHDSFGSVAVGADGTIHAAGYGGSGFALVNPFDGDSGFFSDGVILKLSADGQTVHYASFIGGAFDDEVTGVALDQAGNAYYGGRNQLGTDFPIVGGFDVTHNGAQDAFIAKVDPDGALVWSTFIGGVADDIPRGIVVDADGNATVGGRTSSADFPVDGGFDTTIGGATDAFVTQVDTDGELVWSSFMGSTAFDEIQAIAIDPGGDVYVVGETAAADYPTTDDAFQPAFGGVGDGFVTRIEPVGPSIVWSSYLGGGSGDEASGVAAAGVDEVYVVGITSSPDFPVPGGFDTTLSLSGDGFLVRLDVFLPNGAACDTADECESGICEDGMCCAVACGLCSSCEATGTTCDVVPADDAACGTIACDGLDSTCADYAAITTARCEAAGDCKDADSADCVDFTAIAGACDDADACTEDDACDAGACVGEPILGCGEGGAGGAGGNGSGGDGTGGTGGQGSGGSGGQGTGGAGGDGTGGAGGEGTGGRGTGGEGTSAAGTGGEEAGSGGGSASSSAGVTSASSAAGPATSAVASTATATGAGGDDGGATVAEGDGCDCRTTGGPSSGGAGPAALLVALGIAARRVRRGARRAARR